MDVTSGPFVTVPLLGAAWALAGLWACAPGAHWLRGMRGKWWGRDRREGLGCGSVRVYSEGVPAPAGTLFHA